jgi:hypothetical protein
MMDELDILDDHGQHEIRPQTRPAFLTVLCILTFVGAGLGLIWAFFGWIWVSAAEGLMDAFSTVNSPNPEDNEAYRWMHWLKFLMIAYLVGNALCITGAIIMMFMRKIGFYLYLLGQVIPLIIIVIMLGGNLTEPGSQIWLFMALIFPAGFIVMYGLNFKYLR